MEVVKKKKGPKPGTKYKKRAPAGEQGAQKGKRAATTTGRDTTKRGKTNKKAQEATGAAGSEAAILRSIRHTSAGPHNSLVDMGKLPSERPSLRTAKDMLWMLQLGYLTHSHLWAPTYRSSSGIVQMALLAFYFRVQGPTCAQKQYAAGPIRAS